MEEELKVDADMFKVIMITQDKYLAVGALARKFEGCNTCTRLLL